MTVNEMIKILREPYAGGNVGEGDMTLHDILHILRNPYDHSAVDIRCAQLEAAELLEKMQDATVECSRKDHCTCKTLAQKKICWFSREDWLEP